MFSGGPSQGKRKELKKAEPRGRVLSRFANEHVSVDCMYVFRSHSKMLTLPGASPPCPGFLATQRANMGSWQHLQLVNLVGFQGKADEK